MAWWQGVLVQDERLAEGKLAIVNYWEVGWNKFSLGVEQRLRKARV